MEPVKDVLSRVGRDPHQINNLILVGRSSHLPYIKQKLYEYTGQKPYHGVSSVDSVAHGACIIGGQYIKKQVIQLCGQSYKNVSFIDNISIKSSAPSTIGIVKYESNQKYYEPIIEQGTPFPFTKEILLYSDEVFIEGDSKMAYIPVYIIKNETKIIMSKLPFELPENHFTQNSPLLNLKFYQDQSVFKYSIKLPNSHHYPELKKIDLSIENYKDDKEGSCLLCIPKSNQAGEPNDTSQNKCIQKTQSLLNYNNFHIPKSKQPNRPDSSLPKCKKQNNAPASIEIAKFIFNKFQYYTIISQGKLLPCVGEFNILKQDLNFKKNISEITSFPIYFKKNKEIVGKFDLPIALSKYQYCSDTTLLFTIKFSWCLKNLAYRIKMHDDKSFSKYEFIDTQFLKNKY